MSTKPRRRQGTAVLTAIGMIAAMCAAVLSLASPAAAGTGTNLYDLTCEANALGTTIPGVPTPIQITSTSITPDPADPAPGGAPPGEDVTVIGDVDITVLGAVAAGAIAVAGPGTSPNVNIVSGGTVNIESTNTTTAPIPLDITTPVGSEASFAGNKVYAVELTTGSNVVTITGGADLPIDGTAVGASFLLDQINSLVQGGVDGDPDTDDPFLDPGAVIAAVDTSGANPTLTLIDGDGLPVNAAGDITAADAVNAGYAGASVLSLPGVNLGVFEASGVSGDTMDFSLGDGGSFSVSFNIAVSIPIGYSNCVVNTASTLPGVADAPFGFADLLAGPTSPNCTDPVVAVVGLGQPVNIDLNDECSDVNGDPITYVVGGDPVSDPGGTLAGPTAGTTTSDGAGLVTYQSVSIPASPTGDTFEFSADDGTGTPITLGTVNVQVLANLCDASGAAGDPPGPETCSLTQIVTFNVIGAQRTMEQTGQFVALTDVTLNGVAQLATGSLNDITVLNARGDAAGWTVSGYATDFGTPGAPTYDPDGAGALPAVYDCSPESALIGGVGAPDRLCIPGANMGWAPTAGVTHAKIPGDVADVTQGPASAADAAAWLTQLETGSNAGGLAGYSSAINVPAQSELCTAPVNQAGGTFGCDAELWLGVPASAGAGPYDGAIILTLT